MILHELGEARAGDLLGDRWRDMVVAVAQTRSEAIARAVRDLLADCLSTLPELLARANLPALHFYFATFDGTRRQIFPQALEAYEHFLRSGSQDRLWQLAGDGKERWLATARALLALDPAARDTALGALLEGAPVRVGADLVG